LTWNEDAQPKINLYYILTWNEHASTTRAQM
jgi:hypothetical protein